MSYSTQRVTSDGTLETLAISIEYFDRSEISILTGGIVTPTGWEWVGTTDKTIHFTTPVPTGVEITVLRTTDLSEVRHQLSLGAAFKATTIDEDFTQILHIAQEARENASITDIYQDLNAHGYKIKNIGTSTDAGDAVNFAQFTANNALVQGYVQDASDFADASEASAVRSEAAAVLAESFGSVAPQIHAAEEKTTPSTDDEFGLADSATSNVLKRFKWSSLVTAITSALPMVYATFAQGAKADTALQPTAIGTTVLGYVAPGTSGNVLTSNGGAWVSSPKTGTISTIRLRGGNGYGSTNTAIRRWVTTVLSQGSDITYADSSSLGGSFTVGVTGIYAISYSDQLASNTTILLTVNDSAPSGAPAAADTLAAAIPPSANNPACVAWTGQLTANDVVRARTFGTSVATGSTTSTTHFTITRVG